MNYKIFIIICLFILCYGNINAQDYIEVDASNNEKNTDTILPQESPMPNWQNNWTKESVLAINELITEHGYPDENSSNRMYWIIPGEIKRTITYTESFLFTFPLETNPCNTDSLALVVKNN